MSIIHAFTPFNVVSCSDCGLRYLSPRLKEEVMRKFYEDDRYFKDGAAGGYGDYPEQEESLRLTFRRFLNELRGAGIAGDRLLDVGCGYGFLLDEARELFSFRAGTELSPEAASVAQRLSGADIHIGDIHSAPAGFGDFSVVALVNVIEHIYDPVAYLGSVRQRLAIGGTVAIATPDIGSFWYRVMRRKWPSLKIPEHVAFYTRQTLALALGRAGFASIRHIPFPHAFPAGLICRKLGIPIGGALARKPLWLPGTMAAVTARYG